MSRLAAGRTDYRYAESHRTGFFWLPQSLHSSRYLMDSRATVEEVLPVVG